LISSPPGPTLLGIDVFVVGTILSAIAALAILFAIYAAITVRDPMAKRVKVLNQRREQLKAGVIVNTVKKRASIVRKNETTDNTNLH